MADNMVSSIYKLESINDFDLPYQLYDKLFQRYGKGQFLTDWLRRKGSEFTFTQNLPLNAHEEGRIEETFTTTGASTGGTTPGSLAYVVVDPSDVDSLKNIRPRKYESVYYKNPDDNKMYQLYIQDITPTSTSVSGLSVDTFQLTLKPLNSSLVVGAGGIADGTELTLGGTKYAEYTGHGASTARGFFRRQFYNQISKEKQTLTGVYLGADTFHTKLKNGYKRAWSKIFTEKEFLLDKQMDYDFILGEENTNNVTQADRDGVERNVKSTKGIWKWADELAGKLTYGTSDFDIFNLDDALTYMRSKDVFAKDFLFAVGPDLYTKVENGGLEFIKNYSNTDLTRYFKTETGVKGDKRSAALGLKFACLEKGGAQFMVTPIDTFANTKGLGNYSYDLRKSGMIIPLGNTSKVDGIGEIDNIAIGYNVHGKVNRKRAIDFVSGNDGTEYPASNEYDATDILMMSDWLAFVMGVEQMMQVLPYTSY